MSGTNAVMHTEAAQELAERDGRIPGLAEVLDPDTFLARLAAAGHIAGQTGRLTYTRYKPRTSCLVGYELDDGQRLHASARCWDDWPEKRASHLRPFEYQSRQPFVLEASAITVSFFPQDRVLRTLWRWFDPQQSEALVQRVIPQVGTGTKARLCTLAYKFQRRYVGKLIRNGTAEAVLRFYTRENYQRAHSALLALESGRTSGIARCLGEARRHGVLALEWIGGSSLGTALRSDGDLAEAVDKTASVLAGLHGSHCPGLSGPDRQADAARLVALAEYLSWLCPTLTERAMDLARRLITRLAESPSSPVPIHGDFHADQVVIQPSRAAMIDLDNAALGDPFQDLGNCLAHAEYEALIGDVNAHRVAGFRARLLDAYDRRRTGAESGERMVPCTAAALFRLAPHPFRRGLADWPGKITAILDRVNQMLDSVTTAGALVGSARSASTGGPDSSRGCCPPPATPRRTSCADPPASSAALGNPVPVGSTRDLRREGLSQHAIAESRPNQDADRLMADPEFAFLASAFDPSQVLTVFRRRVWSLSMARDEPVLQDIRLRRHKPGRRCLIEYAWDLDKRRLAMLGKSRVKGVDARTFKWQRQLWASGFDGRSADAVSVPLPLGQIPEFRMWLQEKVPGAPATAVLEMGDEQLPARLAAALHKLHRSQVPLRRSHSMRDELHILNNCLRKVAGAHPGLARRIDRLQRKCGDAAASVATQQSACLHRDFYPDQVLVNGDRLYLVDLDLLARGPAAIDVGNFIGHTTELALRRYGHPDAFSDFESSFVDHYVRLDRQASPAGIEACRTLTLARHVYLSTQFAERRHLTEPLLTLCEQRLGR